MALFRCPDCGELVSTKEKCCPHCGRPTVMDLSGPTVATEDAQPNIPTPVAQPTPPPPVAEIHPATPPSPPSAPPQQQKKKRRGIPPWLLGLIIVFSVLVVGVLCCILLLPDDLFDTEEPARSGYTDGYEWVDLGLSVKWASCNVGASSPEKCGNYYGWGETETSYYYSWDTYDHCVDSRKNLTKYCTRSRYGDVDNKTSLEYQDDAARMEWGGSWRMPTPAEFQELIDGCLCEWETRNNVSGMLFTSLQYGNSIFLPAVGYREKDIVSQRDVAGYYWSSSLIEDKPYGAYRMWFKKPEQPSCDDINQARFYGMQIRPVLD